MTDEIETYEVRAVTKALNEAAAASDGGRFEIANPATARAILKALKLAQARAQKRKIKENHRLFYEEAAKHEAYWARIQPIGSYSERWTLKCEDAQQNDLYPIQPPAEA